MAYAELKARLDEGAIVVLDGGTGTELQKRGANMDPAAWCGPATLENERLLVEIHRDYIRAGAEVITTNTFATSRIMLQGAGYGDQVEEIGRRAVAAAQAAARDGTSNGGEVLVAGSLSHMVPLAGGTDAVDPARVPPIGEYAESAAELAAILKESGVDLIILEMMYDPGRTRAALDAALATGLPVWFGLSARRAADGRVIGFDHTAEVELDEIAGLIPARGVDVAGCMHTGAEITGEALAAVRRHFAGPMLTYPDSGYFKMPDWQFVDIIAPDVLADFYRQWIAAGVQVIGGCCGLGVDHIAAAARVRDEMAGSAA